MNWDMKECAFMAERIGDLPAGAKRYAKELPVSGMFIERLAGGCHGITVGTIYKRRTPFGTVDYRITELVGGIKNL
jgi:hypothetical protein